MTEIAVKIKCIRNEQNLSQSRFGKKIGVSGKTVSAYETGRALPPEKIISMISETFSTPIVYMSSNEKCRLRDQINTLRSCIDTLEKVLGDRVSIPG